MGPPQGPGGGGEKKRYIFQILIPEEDIVLILEDSVIYVNKRETDQLQRKMTKGGGLTKNPELTGKYQSKISFHQNHDLFLWSMRSFWLSDFVVNIQQK